MRILVVDDDYVTRTVLKNLLARYGDCDAVPDGDLALRMFESAYVERVPYRLITMDVGIPGTHGANVVARIRQWEDEHKVFRTGREVDILMITGSVQAENVIRSFRAGCEWYLVKPVTEQKLHAAMEQIGLLGDQVPPIVPPHE